MFNKMQQLSIETANKNLNFQKINFPKVNF